MTAEAATAFDDSVAILDELGSRLELGRDDRRRGLFPRALSEADAGRDDLQRALAMFEACVAAGDRERAIQSLA